MLIEREAEIEAIHRVLRGARSGVGAALLVDGPAGIGKTALLDAAVRLAEGSALVLRARAAAAEQAYAHGIVRQLLADPASERLPLRGAAAMAGAALGLDAGASVADAFAVQHGLYWLCAELAEGRPLLLVVDDAQWADAPSLSWLAHLARRIDELAISMIVSWRAGTPSTVDDLHDELEEVSTVETIVPQPLTEAGVAELASAVSSVSTDEGFARSCAAFTGGNPFYVVEVVRAVIASGGAPTVDAVSLLETSASDVVSREIDRRLRAVGENAQMMADAIAVLDADAELRHAARLAGLNVQAALAAIDELAARLLVDPGSRPRFCHPIVRRGVYEQIPVGQRAALHRRAAQLLEPDRAVGHLLRCPPAEDQEVVRVLLDAAKRDIARGAIDHARALLDRAIREPPLNDRAEVLLALGHAGRLLGDRSALDELREAQRIATSIEVQEEALLEQALLVGLDERPKEALALLDRALALHPTEDEPAIRRLLALRGAYTLTHDELAAKAGDLSRYVMAFPTGRELTADQADLLAVAAAQAALDTSRSAEHAVGWARHAVESGGLEESGSRDLLYGWAARALLWADHGEHAAALIARNIERAASRGWRDGQAIAYAWSAFLAHWEGRLLDARLDAHAATDLGVTGAFGGDFVIAVAASVELDASGPDNAKLLLAHRPNPTHTSTGLLLRWARCRVALATGSHGLAAEEAEAIIASAHRRGAIALGPRATAATALRVANRGDEARALADTELDDARRWGAPGHIGTALRALALLVNKHDQRSLLEASVEQLERSPRRLELARSLLELGSHRRRTRERAAAREHLRTALELALQLGARPLAEEATAELQASGARLQRVRLSGIESLTPSEHRVARLAAQGMSNPEIAQRLYVSRATVETHLTHAYRKLDITSREQLLDTLAESKTK